MGKLQYNEVTPKRAVIIDGDPYLVLSSQTAKKDRQKASNQVKLKNLKTGSVVERTLHQSDSFEEAELEKRELTYLYTNRGSSWFCEPGDRSSRIELPADILGESGRFLKENETVETLTFNEEVISVLVPIKVKLKVVEAAPAVKGNTSQGATKEVTLETGAIVQAPLFINQGDVIRINTETGLYTERVEKA